ncbi:MAG: cytochrome b [Gammaproteobacteria bacterium]|nr:cytochrome b [Gammaproteobacteria bacterium]
MPIFHEKYHLAARLIHWIMAAGFAFMWGCGYIMTTLVEDDSPLEEFLFDLHISVGVTLLALLVLRIAVRLVITPPALPASIRGMERTAAHLGHAALYALPALVIAAGWAETNFGGHAVQWFGVDMPRVFPETGEDLQDLSEDMHMWLAYTMLAAAVGHVAAAFKHRWVDGHDVIRRMAIGGGS